MDCLIGIVIGYICGIIFTPKYIDQATALKKGSVLAIIGSILFDIARSCDLLSGRWQWQT